MTQSGLGDRWGPKTGSKSPSFLENKERINHEAHGVRASPEKINRWAESEKRRERGAKTNGPLHIWPAKTAGATATATATAREDVETNDSAGADLTGHWRAPNADQPRWARALAARNNSNSRKDSFGAKLPILSSVWRIIVYLDHWCFFSVFARF